MKRLTTLHWHLPIILTLGVIATLVFFSIEEEVTSYDHLKRPVSVSVVEAIAKSVRPDIPAWGLVEPYEKIDIRPQVEGNIVGVGDNILIGAQVNKGDILFTIDTSDYENLLTESRAIYNQALQDLAIENGRQKIASAEYSLLKKSGKSIKNDSLILRAPQLKSRKAAVSIAKAKLNQAILNLKRTTLTAPCDGQILAESLAVGHFVEAGALALTIVCTERYHINSSFPSHYEVDDEINNVEITVDGKSYPAFLKTLLPQIDPVTRQKQALVEARDVTLPIGSYASLNLKGKLLQNTFELPRVALRENDTIWILTPENTLEVRTVVIAFKNARQVYIHKGLESGMSVITSHIATPLNGMKLRLSEENDMHHQAEASQ
jgi:RND family efflux transporter MFP subunit